MMRKYGTIFFASVLVIGCFSSGNVSAEEGVFRARASELDSRCQEYADVDFVFELNGKIADWQHGAAPDPDDAKGQLVIWLMDYNAELFERLNGYGLHAIQPHYANKWFSKICQEIPVGENARGNVRLEAATGQDVSEDIGLAPQDGMMERAFQFVKWLDSEDPEGGWAQFIDDAGTGIRWDKVIVSGASHGATTSARFAKHQEVARVVMFCGPRDQFQVWQGMESATPPQRYFGFSHVLDGGWEANHYCRSWQMLGLHEFGPIVDVDVSEAPYGNSRRLTSAADVGGDANRAHGVVTPGKNGPKSEDGAFLYESVWRYLYTHPVEAVGEPVEIDEDCVVKE
jgi:hypothetical protein